MIECLLDESGGYTTPVMQRTPIDPSHGSRPAHGLFAASAEAAMATLVSVNRRPFPLLAGVLVPYARG